MNNSSIGIIILVVLLSSIVVFSGLDTPKSANFAMFCSSVDDVQMAVLDAYSDVRLKHAIEGENRNSEQIYYEIATGYDAGEYSSMQGANVSKITKTYYSLDAAEKDGKDFQRINPDNNCLTNFTLPLVKESRTAWYITKDGRIFNAAGYEYDGKTYFNAAIYTNGTINVKKNDTAEKYAEKIANTINNGLDQCIIF